MTARPLRARLVRPPYARAFAVLAALACACAKSPPAPRVDAGARAGAASPTDAAPPMGTPRAGMAWIPDGTLRAGTPPDRAPRVADEELPGAPIPMHGFYIDLLPYPNEPGAIPTTNVARADAQRLCDTAGKRLCTELEWERACKGPDNATYEYGDAYRAATCGTGVPVEQSAKRPSGERLACASAFGVRDMHGGAWEWTSSRWGRGASDDALGVLRGGNATAGELVGRCANAIGRAPTTKGPTMGFRCCAGPPNDARVDLTLVKGEPLVRDAKAIAMAAPLADQARAPWVAEARDGGGPIFARAWLWHPVPNEEIVIAGGCARTPRGLHCGMIVGHAGADAARVLAEVDTGLDYPEVVQFGDARHLRVRGLELRGGFLRDVTYAYGFVEVSPKRP